MNPVEALDRIAFLLERDLAEPYKVKAFRNAAASIKTRSDDELRTLAKAGRLKSLKGVGAATEAVIVQALDGVIPDYVQKLEEREWLGSDFNLNSRLLQALQGDCHTHSDWSDGGSPIEEMARTARALGRSYIVLTDHSPNLKVANGLTVERLQKQLLIVDDLNATFADEANAGTAEPFRILKGIEVDILEDGTLDQTEEMFGQLDIVVASVHSALRAESVVMTKRMLSAIAHPRMNILGHCTGRKVMGRNRPPSTFNAKAVFEACVENNVAVEINSRPERKDPPMDLLQIAFNMGCMFSIDTDAHAPGQLSWLPVGTERADKCRIPPDRVVNTKSADDLIAWANGTD